MYELSKKEIQAIQETLDLHQSVLDGEYEDYQDAKEDVGYCPLCKAFSDLTNGCIDCPWVTIQGEEYTIQDAEYDDGRCPCVDTVYDYDDDVQSIARLKSWLEGEQYTGDEKGGTFCISYSI